MAGIKLSRRWIAWRRQRYGELLSSGVPGLLAWDTAKGETAARRRIAKITGADAATKADLAYVERDGEVTFILVGSLADIDAKRGKKMLKEFAKA